MKRAAFLAMLVVLVAACGSRHDAGASAEAPGASAHVNGAPAGGRGASIEGLRVRAERQRTGEVTLSIEAHGDGLVRLAGALLVEQRSGSGWTRVEANELSVRADCGATAPACVELAHGGALRPPAWTARSGKGQCSGSSEGAALGAGTYRIVATSCDGSQRAESAPFTIPR